MRAWFNTPKGSNMKERCVKSCMARHKSLSVEPAAEEKSVLIAPQLLKEHYTERFCGCITVSLKVFAWQSQLQ